MQIGYCENCKEDIERMRLGYNPHNESCNNLQCLLLDIANGILIIVFLIPIMIIVIPIAIYFLIKNILWGK